MICIHASLFAFYDLPSNYRKKIFRFIGKTAAGAFELKMPAGRRATLNRRSRD